MTVVCDTSVLCYLILLDCIEILPRRFGEVLVPGDVVNECLHSAAPQKIRAFSLNSPAWLRIEPAPIASYACGLIDRLLAETNFRASPEVIASLRKLIKGGH